MTARRDLQELERQGIARRTHGGAVLPSVPGPRGLVRLGASRSPPRPRPALAEEAVVEPPPGETTLDSPAPPRTSSPAGSSSEGLGVYSSSPTALPIMDAIAFYVETPNVEARRHRRHTAPNHPLVPSARTPCTNVRRALRRPHVLLSVKSVTHDGVMTDADELEAEVKRAMIVQSRGIRSAARRLQARRSRTERDRPRNRSHELWFAHGAPAAALEPLRATGVNLRVVGS